jgi:[acyl-carrier-protein] S-malonyltransferase
MQAAVPAGEGAMAAILGLELDEVQAVVADAAAIGVCAVANDNSPGQVVISGAKEAVEKASKLATERGAKRAMLLPVSAPFHCPLMQPAAERMAEALDKTVIAAPAVPVMANVTAAPVSVPQTIRELLVEQVTATVRWREGVLAMKDHDIATLVELGTGKVLSGLTRRIDRDLEALSVETPAEVEAVLKTF